MATQFDNPFSGGNTNNTPFINPFDASSANRSAPNSGLPESEQLYLQAQMQGGTIAKQADLLMKKHSRNMLSTAGQKLKNTAKDFFRLISLSGNVVSGILDPNISIADAVKEDRRISDAFFGTGNIMSNGEPTTMQKVGDFIIRLPFDILLDPLTWLTYGASSTAGIGARMGFSATAKVDVAAQAAKDLGYTRRAFKAGDFFSVPLSDTGKQVLDYTKQFFKLEQAKYDKFVLRVGSKTTGRMSYDKMSLFKKNLKSLKNDLLESGAIKRESIDFLENETKALVKATMESPLDKRWAERTVGRLMSDNPALMETWANKGGWAFAGKTLLSQQRINKVLSMLPGISYIDMATDATRKALGAFFGVNKVVRAVEGTKGLGGLEYVPNEFRNFVESFSTQNGVIKSDVERMGKELVGNYDLTIQEWEDAGVAVTLRKPPSNPKILEGYKAIIDYAERNQDAFKGINKLVNLDNYGPGLFAPNDTRKIFRGGRFRKEPASTMFAENARFIPQTGQDVVTKVPELGEFVRSIPRDSTLYNKIMDVKSAQEVSFTIGEEALNVARRLEKEGLTTEQIVKHKDYVNLLDVQNAIDKEILAGKKAVQQKIMDIDGMREYLGKISKESDIHEFVKNGNLAGVSNNIGEKINSIITESTRRGKDVNDVIKTNTVKKLLDMKSNVEGILAEKVGNLEGLGLSSIKTDDEIASIVKELTTKIESMETSSSAIQKDIVNLVSAIDEVMISRVTGLAKNKLGELASGSKRNLDVILKRIEDFVGTADIKRLKDSMIAEKIFKSATVAAKDVAGITKDDAVKIINNIVKDEANFQLDVEQLNKIISDVVPDTAEGSAKRAAKKLSDVDISKIKKLYEESDAAKYQNIIKDVDQNALAKFVEGLKDEFILDPTGARRLIDSLVGKENKLKSLFEEIDQTKFAAKKKISELPEDEFFFRDRGGHIYKRFATSAKELTDLGFKNFDTNILVTIMAKETMNRQQILQQHFLGDLARNFGKWAHEAPEGYRKIESAALDETVKDIVSVVGKDGEEMLFHPAIAATVEKMLSKEVLYGDSIQAFLDGYDKLQKYFKVSVTSVFPMFHGRNGISNTFQTYLDIGLKALDPRTNTVAVGMIKDHMKLYGNFFSNNGIVKRMSGIGEDALAAAKEYNQIMDKTVFKDRFGYEWSYSELLSELKKNDIAFNPHITGSMDFYNERDDIVKNLGIGVSKKEKILSAANPLNADKFIPYQLGKSLGQTIETQARLLNFVTNLERTGDVAMSAARTKMVLFDYSSLSTFEREVLRRVIPFYTWTRKNLELQARVLMSTPGKIASEVKVVRSIGDMVSSDDAKLTPEEEKLLPPWLKNTIKLAIRRNGERVDVLTGFGLPIEQPFQSLTSNGFLGSISPLLKYPVEWLTGYDMFKGKATSDVIDAKDFRDAPKFLQGFIGYVEYKGVTKDGKEYISYHSLAPSRMAKIYNIPMVGRVMSTIGNLSDDDIASQERFLQLFTGIKIDEYNMESLRAREEADIVNGLEKILRDAGIRGQFTRGYTREGTTILEN